MNVCLSPRALAVVLIGLPTEIVRVAREIRAAREDASLPATPSPGRCALVSDVPLRTRSPAASSTNDRNAVMADRLIFLGPLLRLLPSIASIASCHHQQDRFPPELLPQPMTYGTPAGKGNFCNPLAAVFAAKRTP